MLFRSATTATVNAQHQVVWYQEAKEESVCYEQTYIDEHFKEQGFRPGHCDERYNVVLSHDNEVICDHHSEENIKYCPGETRTIVVVKKGIKTEGDYPPPLGVLYHLEAEAETVCFETNYTDDHYRENGFVIGHCDPVKYNTIENLTDVVICNGHSEENIKYCPTTQITISIYKFGSKTAAGVAATAGNHTPFYHLEATAEPVCYETNYTDANYQENGFTIGACGSDYNTLEETKTVAICNGHSEKNIKNCPGDVVNITVLKLGKA